MKEPIKLETRQAIFLLIIVLYATAEFVLSKNSFILANHDNWMIAIILGLFGIIVSLVIVTLANLFKGKTIIEYSKDILGKKLGFIIGLLYCIFYVQINSVIVGEFAQLLAGPFYPTTPLWFFSTTIVLTAAYVVNKGLGILGRVADVIFPLYLLAIIFFPLANLGSMDFSNLKPVFSIGFKGLMQASKSGTIWFGEIALILMMFPLLKKQEDGYKITIITILCMSLLLTLSSISLVSIFGDEIESLSNPYIELVRYVKISDSLERPESYLLFIWTCSLVLKIGAFFYCAVEGITQLFNTKKKFSVIIGVSLVLIVLSLYTIQNSALLTVIITKYLVYPYFVIQFVIPSVLLIIAKIRKVGGSNEKS